MEKEGEKPVSNKFSPNIVTLNWTRSTNVQLYINVCIVYQKGKTF